MNKKIAIVGAGISGLSAGIYALQAGYSVTIYEKNKMAGGECTGWNRHGFHIDNCIHFLLGCNDSDQINEIWKNLGVLSDDVQLYREPYFYCMEKDGITLHLWRDLERTRKEFLEIAPEDQRELNLFFDCVKNCECIKPPCDISPAHMNLFQFMKMGMSMKQAAKANAEYGKQTMQEFVNRFQNPYVRGMFGNYFNSNFIAITFVTSYAFYTSNSVAIPMGGSVGMIQRMCKRFEELGGTLNLGVQIDKIHIKNNRIISIEADGQIEKDADDYIWCADPRDLFYQLIDVKYIDKNLKYMYDHQDGYVASTGYQAAFGIASDEELELPEGSVIFPCEPYTVANENHDFCGMRVYDYDASLFPKEKRVIQCNVLQNAVNYEYWEKLRSDKKTYDAEKERVAYCLMERLEQQYPVLKGKLVLLNTYSPVTFTSWCRAYKGGYMSFNALKGYKSKYVKSTVKGIDNLFLGSQWVQNSGGLPIAAASGKFAVQQLCKREQQS
ncbi:MAG: NAD(P)/FAD-dependent oxidoreductase [Acetatifactor sp.]|nr:NAD(P)/FAD-dependent oxidoreductase [Acetatifactor sp.]